MRVSGRLYNGVFNNIGEAWAWPRTPWRQLPDDVVRQAQALSDEELLSWTNFGRRTLAELRALKL